MNYRRHRGAGPCSYLTSISLTQPVRVTPRSKGWWNRDVKGARGAYCQARRAWQGQHITTTDLREARNNYYQIIRKAKRTCWETFLAGPTDAPDHSREETARCWQALRLTKPKGLAITPTLKGPQVGGSPCPSTRKRHWSEKSTSD